jgi:hypothetical protein
MNDDGGTLSDLWREERDACMSKGRGRERRGTVLGKGEMNRVIRVIRECVTLYRRQGGDRKASHRKHTDRANWKCGKIKGRTRERPLSVCELMSDCEPNSL